ncbi:MAG: biotin--[acetyl-CoA-carboxylase] ligase [Actinomycetota bacterium]|nr:biotin--[acetyl-CoA-carboxylase] ligase [Actinomycetota bacterium]
MATPYVTIVCDEVSSTQDLAATELSRSPDPVLIVASRQTLGRGRYGNEWWQAPRAVLASLAFRNDVLPVAETLSLTVGLAVRAALAELAGVEVSLKWPNDLELRDGKVGGILIESDGDRTIVGCGINLWWPDAPPGVAAACQLEPVDELGVRLAEGWADKVFASGGRWDRETYLAACSTLGAELTWIPDGKGTAIDIDSRGGLVVSTPQGNRTLRSGEVRTVRRV